MIFQQDRHVRIISNPGAIKQQIAPGNYLVQYNDMTGEYSLLRTDDFTLPDVIYGKHNDLSERYLKTFRKKQGNLGILLKGLKGTGKSLLAKKICIESNLPVLLVTKPYSGPGFEDFLQNIKEPSVVFIDEFEKTYSSSGSSDLKNTGSQADLLSILDGTFSGKKLFLFTANEDLQIASAMLNRPGRIHYLKEFRALTDEVISDIADDLLKDPSKKDELLQVLFITGNVNMDALLTLIEEMNEYDETAKEAISYLNIRPEVSTYIITWEVDIEVFDRTKRRSELTEKDIEIKTTTVTCTTTESIFSNPNKTLFLDGYVDTFKLVDGDYQNWRFAKQGGEMNTSDIRLELSECKINMNSEAQLATVVEPSGKVFKIKRKSTSIHNAYNF